MGPCQEDCEASEGFPAASGPSERLSNGGPGSCVDSVEESEPVLVATTECVVVGQGAGVSPGSKLSFHVVPADRGKRPRRRYPDQWSACDPCGTDGLKAAGEPAVRRLETVSVTSWRAAHVPSWAPYCPSRCSLHHHGGRSAGQPVVRLTLGGILGPSHSTEVALGQEVVVGKLPFGLGGAFL